MSAKEIAYDIETSNPTVKSKDRVLEYNQKVKIHVSGISYAWGRDSVDRPWTPGNAAYIPLMKRDDTPYWGSGQSAVIEAVKKIQESQVPKSAHNGKFDSKTLYRKLGIKTNNFWFDTMLAHALIDEEKIVSSHALKSDFSKDGKITKLGISDAYLDTSSSSFKEDLGDALTHYDPIWRRYSKVPLDVLYPYACADADMTLSLRFVLAEILQAENTAWVFQNITMPLSHAIMLLEIHGCPLDIEKARTVEREQLQLQADLEKEIQEIVGKEFNVASPKQLGEILFEYLNLPGGIRNKSGWATDAEVIESLEHPIKEPLSKYRRSQQIQGTYASPSIQLVEEISEDGKIGWVHPEIWLDSVTGRLKCRDPNLTNLPRKENGGQIVKGMWSCPDTHRFLFKDFSQMELRVAAHVSQEPEWVNGFIRGQDMHSATAKAVYKLDCPVEQVAELFKALRSAAKTINFGILYGKEVYSLAKDLGISPEEADKLINVDYFGAAPVLKAWVDDTHKFVEDNGYVLNMFNRRRHLPDAMLVVPNGTYWPKGDRPDCYRDMASPDDLKIDKCDLHVVDESSLKQKIKTLHQARYFKCTNCPHIKSCFINTEVRRVSQTKARAMRQSVNTIVQGSAADMSSLSLIWMTQEFRKYNWRSAPVLYIHDEIGCYTHTEDLEKAEKIMEACMVSRLVEFTKFRLPLATDTKVVQCWGDK